MIDPTDDESAEKLALEREAFARLVNANATSNRASRVATNELGFDVPADFSATPALIPVREETATQRVVESKGVPIAAPEIVARKVVELPPAAEADEVFPAGLKESFELLATLLRQMEATSNSEKKSDWNGFLKLRSRYNRLRAHCGAIQQIATAPRLDANARAVLKHPGNVLRLKQRVRSTLNPQPIAG